MLLPVGFAILGFTLGLVLQNKSDNKTESEPDKELKGATNVDKPKTDPKIVEQDVSPNLRRDTDEHQKTCNGQPPSSGDSGSSEAGTQPSSDPSSS